MIVSAFISSDLFVGLPFALGTLKDYAKNEMLNHALGQPVSFREPKWNKKTYPEHVLYCTELAWHCSLISPRPPTVPPLPPPPSSLLPPPERKGEIFDWRKWLTSIDLWFGNGGNDWLALIFDLGTDCGRLSLPFNKFHHTYNNNNNNNNNHHHHHHHHLIQRRNSRFFFLTISSLRREPSPTRKLKWPGRNRVQITCNTSSAYIITCNVSCYVPLTFDFERNTYLKFPAQVLTLGPPRSLILGQKCSDTRRSQRFATPRPTARARNAGRLIRRVFDEPPLRTSRVSGTEMYLMPGEETSWIKRTSFKTRTGDLLRA